MAPWTGKARREEERLGLQSADPCAERTKSWVGFFLKDIDLQLVGCRARWSFTG
jgi:hypothetical protein